jgi:polyphosphate kinase 2 (PPK2 family)
MKPLIVSFILALVGISVSSAGQPTSIVSSEQQANRDKEKLNILHNESNEQRQLAAQLQQKRALDLQNGNQEALAKTEARLEEVTGNIAQLQQEIDLAQGKPGAIKPVTVRLTPQRGAEPTGTAPRDAEQANNQARQWWDLYNKRKN